jgi:hypothetical protein
MKQLLSGLMATTVLAMSVTAFAAPPVQTDKAGMSIVTTHCDGISLADKINRYDYSDLKVVKVHMPGAFCSDPSAVQQLISRGVTTVILRTEDSNIGWGSVKNDIERIQGSGDSYDALIRRNPGVTFWLEVGNEPNNAGYNGVGDVWGYRWTALDTYKTLALNSYGKIAQAWRQKYPNLKWAISVPTTYNDMQVVLQWQAADGGVRDYYDAVATHLYGSFNLFEGNNWNQIYNFLVGDQYTKAILITEAGIHDPGTSDTTKAQRYFAFMRDTAYANAKIKAVTFWHFDAAADDTGTSYSMESQSDLHIVRYNW